MFSNYWKQNAFFYNVTTNQPTIQLELILINSNEVYLNYSCYSYVFWLNKVILNA